MEPCSFVLRKSPRDGLHDHRSQRGQGALAGFRRAREREVKSAAQPDVALDPDAAVVRFDDSFRDGETEPNPATVRRLRLPEATKDVWHLLGRNARAGVDDSEPHLTVNALCAYGDATASRSELHGVSDQIRQHLLNSGGVGQHGWKTLIDAGLESYRASCGERAQHVYRVVDESQWRFRPRIDGQVT